MTLAPVIAHDLRLQWRYGIYAAYGAVIALYAALLVSARGAIPDWAVAILVYSDPSALGFFFLGGLMLLEKGEGVRHALAISPLSARAYLFSKTLTLTVVSLLAVLALAWAKGGTVVWWLLLVSVALTAAFYLAVGVAFALRFKTVNGYIIGSAALLTPVIGPALLALLDPMPAWLALYPPAAQFRLILIALGTGENSGAMTVWMLLVATVACGLALWAAERVLRTELGPK